MAVTACKREVRRKLLRKTSNQVLKISTYQLSQSVKVMVTDEYHVFGHRLEGLLIHVDGERDGIMLCASRHIYSKIIRIKVVHVRNRRLRLVERTPTVDDFQSCDAPIPEGPVDHRQPAENLCVLYHETHT